MFTDNKDSKRTGIILIIVALIVILIISFIFGGVGGIFGVLRFFMTSLFVVTFIGAIVFVVWFLFIKPHRRDLAHENWKEYVRGGLDNGSDMMEDLVLTGDKNHSMKKFLTIKGYLRVMGFDGNEYDMFIGKKNPQNIFEDYKVVMLKPKDHSDLIGDVYVYGISLIFKYGFYFVNTQMLDFKAIDQTVANDTFRKLMYVTLGDMKAVVDRAMGLDSDYSKNQQSQKLLKIPVLSGQQPNQNQQSGGQQ